jgi:hypothetical protein
MPESSGVDMFLSGPGEQLEWLPIANIMDFEKTIKIC